MKSNKKKCQESIDIMYNEILKCFNDLTSFRSVCSNSIIDCRTDKQYNTSWVCDRFFYDDIKKSLANIKYSERYLDIIVKNKTKQAKRLTEHQAYVIIEQLIKCRFINNMLSTAAEKIIVECLRLTYQVLLMQQRYLNYDITIARNKVDIKNVKLKNSLDFQYDYNKVIRYDFVELERIANHLIISQQNSDGDTYKMCKNLLFCLFVDSNDDMRKIILCEMNFNKIRDKFIEIALSRTLDDYTFKTKVNDEEFTVTIVVFSTDATDVL